MKGIAAVNLRLKQIHGLTADRRGVTALEYAMIASLIATSVVSIVTSLGSNLTSVIGTVSSAL